MDEQHFEQFLSELQKHLSQPKCFVTDIDRARELYYTVDLAKQLFPDATIEINADPLQTGTMFLHIESADIVVRGEKEMELFIHLVALANNFEIYSINGDQICFAAAFQGVNKRV